jgi:hypothetical protein
VTRPRPGLRDLYAVVPAVLLVVAAVLIGRHLQATDHSLLVGWPPLIGRWDPHVGPGTPAAVLLAVATVAYGPSVAARLPWRALLAASWGTATAWIWSLALIDGWHRGIAVRLTTRFEYLQVIDRWHDIPATLRDFTRHILIDSPDNWPAHVAGHPPAATLTFVLLDRIGLRGGGWAGVWCITVGATGCRWRCGRRPASGSPGGRRPSWSWRRPRCGWARRPTGTSRRSRRGPWRCWPSRSPDARCGGRRVRGCCSA